MERFLWVNKRQEQLDVLVVIPEYGHTRYRIVPTVESIRFIADSIDSIRFVFVKLVKKKAGVRRIKNISGKSASKTQKI